MSRLLAAANAQGRIETEELEERLSISLSARSLDELERAVEGLPVKLSPPALRWLEAEPLPSNSLTRRAGAPAPIPEMIQAPGGTLSARETYLILSAWVGCFMLISLTLFFLFSGL